jgi:hypothetical protein
MKPKESAEISSSKLLIIASLLVVVLIVTVSLMPAEVKPIQTSEFRIDIITLISNTTHFEVYLDSDTVLFASVTIEPGGNWSGYANLTRGPHHINLYICNSTSILNGNTALGDTYWLQHEFWVYPPHTLTQKYILTANGLRILESPGDWHPD